MKASTKSLMRFSTCGETELEAEGNGRPVVNPAEGERWRSMMETAKSKASLIEGEHKLGSEVGAETTLSHEEVVQESSIATSVSRRERAHVPKSRRLTARTIQKALTEAEVREFASDLVRAASTVVHEASSENLRALARVLRDWEYTIDIKRNANFRSMLEDTEKEIQETPGPGVPWRDLFRS